MDERMKKPNEYIFMAPIFIFGASNLAFSILISLKRPRSVVIVYIVTLLYFSSLASTMLPFRRLRTIIHAGGFNGWRHIHAATIASWVYITCVSSEVQKAGLSIPSCLILGFGPSVVCYLSSFNHMKWVVRNEMHISEMIAHTHDVLLFYHRSLMSTQDGASSAQKSLERMRSALKSDMYGPRNVSKRDLLPSSSSPLEPCGRVSWTRVAIVMALSVAEAAIVMTMFKGKPCESSLGLMGVAMMAAQTVVVHLIDTPDEEYLSSPTATRPYTAVTVSVAMSVVGTWVIYFETMKPFAIVASMFHLVDAASTLLSRFGAINDVIHSSVVMIVSIMITL